MVKTIYKVFTENGFVEFTDLQLAQNYCLENGLNAELISNEERDTAKKKFIPNVTPRQIRQALVLSNVSMAQIDAALDQLPEPQKSLARISWEYSTAFIRNEPFVASVGLILGWTNQQIDDLWELAGTL